MGVLRVWPLLADSFFRRSAAYRVFCFVSAFYLLFLVLFCEKLFVFFFLDPPWMSGVAHVMNAPAFDGRAGSFANYEETAGLRIQISTTGPQKRAAKLLLRASDVARKVCMAGGKDVVGNIDGVEQISRISRERCAPDAIDGVFQDMATLM